MAWRNGIEEAVVRRREIQVAVLARAHFQCAVEPIAADPQLICDRQLRVALAVVRQLGGETRQEFVLDAESELPFGATPAPPVEQALAVKVAVGLHSGRDPRFPASALCRLQANWRTSHVETERVAAVIPRSG